MLGGSSLSRGFILVGSYGAIKGANMAKTKITKKINDPTKAIFLVYNAENKPLMIVPLHIFDPGVENGVREIYKEVYEHIQKDDDENDSLDYRIVTTED